MSLSGCVPRSREITELDVWKENINMLTVKKTESIPIVFALHMEVFGSYNIAGDQLSERSSPGGHLLIVLCLVY